MVCLGPHGVVRPAEAGGPGTQKSQNPCLHCVFDILGCGFWGGSGGPRPPKSGRPAHGRPGDRDPHYSETKSN